MNTKELLTALNEQEFMAFPQKNNPERVTVSIIDEEGTRCFLTRAAIGVNVDGTPNYQWVKGKPMQKQENIQNAQTPTPQQVAQVPA